MNHAATLDLHESLGEESEEVLSKNPSGVSKTQILLEEFLTKPFEEQKKDVDQKWLELAFALPTRALRLALTATKKEMGQVQQIVTAAAIAKDKRFPASDDSLTVKIPARMLGNYSCAIILKPIENAQSVEHVIPKS